MDQPAGPSEKAEKAKELSPPRPTRDDRPALASEVARLTSLVDKLRAEGDALRASLERREQHGDLKRHLREVQRLEGLGVLARTIAHDFNNQLTVILGNCSLAQADLEAGSPLHQRLNRVRKAAQISAGLTEQLLIYSGAPASSAKAIHLPHLLANMRELMEASVGGRCELSIEGPAQLPLIDADETEIQQVVVNLITNASESLQRRAGHAWIRTGVERVTVDELADCEGAPDLPEADYVYLEVEDDGVGIEAVDLPRIFEPFFTSQLPGRGLGLAAVLAIVESHGGAIKVDSIVGQGTKVRVLLPPAPSKRRES